MRQGDRAQRLARLPEGEEIAAARLQEEQVVVIGGGRGDEAGRSQCLRGGDGARGRIEGVEVLAKVVNAGGAEAVDGFIWPGNGRCVRGAGLALQEAEPVLRDGSVVGEQGEEPEAKRVVDNGHFAQEVGFGDVRSGVEDEGDEGVGAFDVGDLVGIWGVVGPEIAAVEGRRGVVENAGIIPFRQAPRFQPQPMQEMVADGEIVGGVRAASVARGPAEGRGDDRVGVAAQQRLVGGFVHRLPHERGRGQRHVQPLPRHPFRLRQVRQQLRVRYEGDAHV